MLPSFYSFELNVVSGASAIALPQVKTLFTYAALLALSEEENL